MHSKKIFKNHQDYNIMFSNYVYWGLFSFIISFKINVNQCRKVSIAAFRLLSFFDFIDPLTFSSFFRHIE